MKFTEFNLNESLAMGISDAGYVDCTPVQEQVLQSGSDGSASGIRTLVIICMFVEPIALAA